jgi:hypothetical protein
LPFAINERLVEKEFGKMGEKRVSDLTIEEFKALVSEIIDERIRLWRQPQPVVDKEALKKTFESIDRHLWTPPPGTQTGSEMIIQERRRQAES